MTYTIKALRFAFYDALCRFRLFSFAALSFVFDHLTIKPYSPNRAKLKMKLSDTTAKKILYTEVCKSCLVVFVVRLKLFNIYFFNSKEVTPDVSRHRKFLIWKTFQIILLIVNRCHSVVYLHQSFFPMRYRWSVRFDWSCHTPALTGNQSVSILSCSRDVQSRHWMCYHPPTFPLIYSLALRFFTFGSGRHMCAESFIQFFRILRVIPIPFLLLGLHRLICQL